MYICELDNLIMVIIRHIIIATSIISILVSAGCRNSTQTDSLRAVTEWNGRQITFPVVMTDYLTGDTIDLSDSDFTILTYVDSAGCTECKMKLMAWNTFFNRLDANCNDTTTYNTITIVHQSIERNLQFIIKRSQFENPVYVDIGDSIYLANKFADKMMFQTLLLNSDKRVLAIGNPIYNPKIADLYISQISGKDVSGVNKDAIYIHSPSHDFGSVLAGDTVRHTFSIINPSKDTIKILKIIPSCECTTAQPSDTIIAPKQSADIYVTFSDSTETGDLYRTVDIMFDKYDRPLQIEIFANVSKNETSYIK